MFRAKNSQSKYTNLVRPRLKLLQPFVFHVAASLPRFRTRSEYYLDFKRLGSLMDAHKLPQWPHRTAVKSEDNFIMLAC